MIFQENLRASNTKILIISSVEGCIAYENVLRRSNFQNIRLCHDGITGLQIMEQDTPDVLVMDAEMPEMDGYEFAGHVREIERTERRFTNIVLISESAVGNEVDFISQSNIDAIISKDVASIRLVPQIMAGERIALQMNRLLSDNSLLSNKCGSLEENQLLDPLTGLGNRRQAMKGIEDTVRQIEARGGAIALLLVKMMDTSELIQSYGQNVLEELIVSMGEKIRKLVRPLDVVAYFDRGTFAIIMQHNSLEHCTESSYERIREGLVLKNFQTRAGYLQPQISIGVCGAGAETGPPKSSCLIANAMSNLNEESVGELKVTVLNPF